jgi:precorrin-3B C17-methyltransferase
MARGVLHIVGVGPGGAEHRTFAAARAVAEAEVVVGYGPYVDLVADLVVGEVIRGVMGEEERRADEALALAAGGARVALVSSGDAGVHGMAARTLARAASLDVDVVVVPGVTAAQAAAAAIGAPLTDDFAVLSLSDISTSWQRVEARLRALAGSGLALCLYNPRSARRTEQFDRALAILRAARGRETPVALAHNVTRPAEAIELTTLGALAPERVTMQTLVVVAGDTAAEAGPWLIALRSAVPAPAGATT